MLKRETNEVCYQLPSLLAWVSWWWLRQSTEAEQTGFLNWRNRLSPGRPRAGAHRTERYTEKETAELQKASLENLADPWPVRMLSGMQQGTCPRPGKETAEKLEDSDWFSGSGRFLFPPAIWKNLNSVGIVLGAQKSLISGMENH